MPVTEVTSVFNTTDETIKFINQESPRDTKEILPQSAVSMKTEKTDGAWVPWFHPPRFLAIQQAAHGDRRRRGAGDLYVAAG